MAVQAQYPSSSTFGIWSIPLEDIQRLQNMNGGNPFGGYQNYAGQHILNGTTVFSEPESDLTCNASGSRKRTRENQMVAATLKTHQFHYQHQLQLPTHTPPNLPHPAPATAPAVTSGSSLHMFPDLPNNRRPHHDDGAGGSSASGTSSLSSIPQYLYSYLCTQNLDMDAFIRHQNHRLRCIVEETRKKHCRSLLSIMEQQTLKRLEEKEVELENVSRVNAQLQEKVKQMSAENQMWFNAAKNSEARVSGLRSSLEQMLVQNAGGGPQAIEGFGETEVEEDAESCCNEDAGESEEEEELKQQQGKTCKCCGGSDISVLLLPCRHLCVCKDCGMKVKSCPICNSVKNATLRVFMS